MRHGKKVNHLGRTDSHRKAMLANMAISLIKHKRITTTLAKAKSLRMYVEPIITKSKNDTTHSRRTVFSYLQDKEVITILFREVAEKVANRPGGYTRIIKLNNRLGDNAEMALIELVDFNEVYGKETEVKEEKKTTRRGKTKAAAAPKAAKAKAETTEEVAPAEEAPATETEEAKGE
ncbi:50S ribosomal protein L17 [Pedobacter nototheniae]|uniref:50S ribosomal protein L17 n=1 Tax=Pedobacter nototheniae TaxID=2488994 RepID=UPI00292E2B6C|nr:50S ribosomal protein L17 [Pedobacter nototheniae]